MADDAAAAVAEHFGAGEDPSPVAPAMPEGYVAKFWDGSPDSYAATVSEGYRNLEKAFTAAAQRAGGETLPETHATYGAWMDEATRAGWDRLDLDDGAYVGRLNAALHAAGVGPKAAEAAVRHLLDAEQAAVPEPQSPEARRSAVIHELGPNGAQMVSQVATKLASLARGGGVDAAGVEALAGLLETAAGAKALHAFVGAATPAPPSTDAVRRGEQVRQERVDAIRRQLTDPTVVRDRAKVAALAEEYERLTPNGTLLDGKALVDGAGPLGIALR